MYKLKLMSKAKIILKDRFQLLEKKEELRLQKPISGFEQMRQYIIENIIRKLDKITKNEDNSYSIIASEKGSILDTHYYVISYEDATYYDLVELLEEKYNRHKNYK